MGGNGAKPIRVLVVEDDPDLGHLIALTLRKHDMQVVRARDGIAALEEARRLEPHVAIVDLGLPHLGGHALGRRLHEMQHDSGLPHLIAVTGDASAAAEEASRASGFTAHLVKPAKPNELVGMVRDLVG
ncbi:MAG TPA: response regulator [Sandaracinaceae bacterium LLY-WYZ-13_1]|nr:response regulator [Sandaracinaceae bacterium LLY-WYZ-13_1]